MKKPILLALALTACGGPSVETSEAAIANQAESLERAAEATVNQQIAEIEAAAAAEQPEGADVSINLADNATGE